MKAIIVLLCAFMTVHALEKNDFAFERIVENKSASQHGVIRIDLPLSVYGHVNGKALLDIAVFDAHGNRMPHMLKHLNATSQTTQRQSISFARIKTLKEQQNSSVLVSYRGKEITFSENTLLDDEDYILDTSMMKDGVDYLVINSSDREYMMSAESACSNDLSHWRSISHAQTLANITMAKGNIVKKRLNVNITHCNYIKVHTQKPLGIESITAVKTVSSATKLKSQILDFRKVDTAIEFNMPQFLTLQGLQFGLSKQKQIYAFNIFTKNSSTQKWLFLKRINIVSSKTQQESTLEARLNTNAKFYRMVAASGSYMPQELQLSFTYNPIQLYFLAQGKTPYSLVYGSLKSVKSSASLKKMLLQKSVYTTATLKEEKVLNSSATIVLKKRDYKAILVWLSLLLGVSLLGFMSYKLLVELKSNK